MIALPIVLLAPPRVATRPTDFTAAFRTPPAAARLRMFWHVFGPAWERQEIGRELSALQRAHVGGVMTAFTYPVAVDDTAAGVRNQRFNSPEFLATLRYAATTAGGLGLSFGVYGGTGWPFGGPTVSPADSAQRIRQVHVDTGPDGIALMPSLAAGETLVAAFEEGKDVTEPLSSHVLIPEQRPVTAYIAGPTMMRVKRPSLGAEGLVVDHMSSRAVQRYLDAAVAPLTTAAQGMLDSVFCDSLEVYRENWTHDFASQFEERRGYPLVPRLDALFSDTTDTPALRFDFWRTAAEVARDEFVKTTHAWTRSHGVKFALEPYGTPSLGLDAVSSCDEPWGEQYEWNGLSFMRYASSGAHLAGKRIIGAEAWTWIGLPNRLGDTLSDLKLCSDIHFLQGANRLYGVTFPYSPASAGSPGWLPYFGPVFGLANPQWLCFRDFADYVGRCQYMLQRGRPVADVAVYLPTEDAMAHSAMDQLALDFRLRDMLASGPLTDEFDLRRSLRHRSNVVASIQEAGYDYDGIDFEVLGGRASVNEGAIDCGDGRYRILVLPNVEAVEAVALRRMAEFCADGGTIIATKRIPARVYGAPAEVRDCKPLLATLFHGASGGYALTRVAAGRVIFAPDDGESLRRALAESGVAPDHNLGTSGNSVGCVHRTEATGDTYFLANTTDQPVKLTARLRCTLPRLVEADPMTGNIGPARATRDGHFTAVTLNLGARGSMLLRFSNGRSAGVTPEQVAGSRLLQVAGPWTVSFHGPDAPEAVTTNELASWTDWPGGAGFSGSATYDTEVDIPGGASHCALRLGTVHECARVSVNGRPAGSSWMPGQEVQIGSLIHAGRNRLSITVANLPVNRYISLPRPDYTELRRVYGDRFPDPQEHDLVKSPMPSGLLGPVTLEIGGSGAKP